MSTLAADNGPFEPAGGQVPPEGGFATAAQVVRLPRTLHVKAAERLVSEGGSRQAAAKRFVAGAPGFGIDLSLMWGTLTPNGRGVRQVCLAVLGAGRTAMLFVSGPWPGGERPEDVAERTACIEQACRHVGSHGGAGRGGQRPPAVLAQALLEPGETAQEAGLLAAGFMKVGTLAYVALRRERGGFVSGPPVPAPVGFELKQVGAIAAEERERLLAGVLEETYIETLDCPELCGLREARDVLESHRAVGSHDPNLWWLVLGDASAGGGPGGGGGGRPMGCMLLNPCPEQDCVELVYLGLSPSIRGRGVARWALDHGLRAIAGRRESRITCAVDVRNAPAMRLYEGLGFKRLAERTPFVRGIGPGAS